MFKLRCVINPSPVIIDDEEQQALDFAYDEFMESWEKSGLASFPDNFHYQFRSLKSLEIFILQAREILGPDPIE